MEEKDCKTNSTEEGGSVTVTFPALTNTSMTPFFLSAMSDKDTKVQILDDETVKYEIDIYAFEPFTFDSQGIFKGGLENPVSAVILDSTEFATLNLAVKWTWGK